MSLPLILSVDPGHDDFFLLLYSLFSPQTNILGIATTAGNQSLEKVTINTLNTLNIFTNQNVFDPTKTDDIKNINFASIPVVPGADHSIVAANTICPEIHGESGLESNNKEFQWPALKNKAITGTHAVQYMEKLITEYTAKHDEKVHLIASGKLTDVALLFTMYPHVLTHIAQLTIMGGSYKEAGNTGTTCEFNIQIDPEAAQMVFSNGCSPEELHILQTEQKTPSTTTLRKIPIVLIPLDVTHTVLVTDDVLEKIKKVCCIPGQPDTPTPFAHLLTDLLTFFSNTYRDVFGFREGPPLHDPVTFFYLSAIQHNISNNCIIDPTDPTKPPRINNNSNSNNDSTTTYPSVFTTIHTRVDVDTSHGICRGTTCFDVHGILPHKPKKNVILATKVNVDAFWAHFMMMMERANRQCTLNQPVAQ